MQLSDSFEQLRSKGMLTEMFDLVRSMFAMPLHLFVALCSGSRVMLACCIRSC
jgi:hypothetical protein